MTFDTTFLNRIECVPLFCSHTTMAIDTFDNIELIARALFNTNASLSLNQSFNRDMAVFTFDFLSHFSMMAVGTVFLKCLSVVFAWGMAVGTSHPAACHLGFMGKFSFVEG